MSSDKSFESLSGNSIVVFLAKVNRPDASEECDEKAYLNMPTKHFV